MPAPEKSLKSPSVKPPVDPGRAKELALRAAFRAPVSVVPAPMPVRPSA